MFEITTMNVSTVIETIFKVCSKVYWHFWCYTSTHWFSVDVVLANHVQKSRCERGGHSTDPHAQSNHQENGYLNTLVRVNKCFGAFYKAAMIVGVSACSKSCRFRCPLRTSPTKKLRCMGFLNSLGIFNRLPSSESINRNVFKKICLVVKTRLK